MVEARPFRRYPWVMRFGALTLALLIPLSGCSKPEPPKITPRSISVKSVAPEAVTLHVALDVQNPNAFPLLVSSVTGKFMVGAGAEVGSASAAPNGSIPAKGSAPVETDMRVGWTNLAALAPLALSGQPVPYTFEGNAAIGGEKLNVNVPFQLKGELTQAQVVQAGLKGLPAGIPPPF